MAVDEKVKIAGLQMEPKILEKNSNLERCLGLIIIIISRDIIGGGICGSTLAFFILSIEIYSSILSETFGREGTDIFI